MAEILRKAIDAVEESGGRSKAKGFEEMGGSGVGES